MADVVLFHHVLGLTPGIEEFAELLRAGGHTVHTPDLFDGARFDTLEAGVHHAAEEIGFAEVLARGTAAVEGLGAGLVYAGYSMGVLPAQKLAQTRPGAAGALFIASCVPVTEFSASWPEGVPVQIHAAETDPEFVDSGDIDAARDLIGQAAQGEMFLYPGGAHFFADSSTAEYDAGATDTMLARVLQFLGSH
ncbi:dienelactone hydrolase family protein [Arthrobacter sp. JSM 101049]|uniref:dienelactone hydrolase family protein n=1 Tax=Arthrobacter sp. JSM 101049 TaxID=929097 RepID=UPI00356A9E02